MKVLRRSSVALAAAALFLAGARASAGSAMTTYPTIGDPLEIVAALNGTLYWAEYAANAIGYRLPGGTIGHVVIPEAFAPQRVAAASDGTIWFTGGLDRIGRYDPDAPIYVSAITVFDAPAGSLPTGLCQGSDGNIWFTEYKGNQIARITPSGAVLEFPIPTAAAHPWDITPGPDGSLYFTEAAGNKVGRITMDGSIHEEDVGAGNPSHITLGPDGAVWFSKISAHEIGRLARSRSGVYTLTNFPMPTGAGVITTGPDGALWFVRTREGIGRLTTSGSVFEYTLEAGFYPGITRGVDGAIWFTESSGKLCRVPTGGDVNRDGTADVLDVFFLINYLFASGPAPQ